MVENVTFHDYKPENLSLYDAIVEGLSLEQKSIPPKFFYDERGSQLFDAICEQPEYYPPTVELGMLNDIAKEVAELTGMGRVLIEPGAGSAKKIRVLLNALRPSAFIPMDISFEHLKSASLLLAKEYPWLRVHATCVDFTHSLPIPSAAPEGDRLLFFPGSSIGNFHPEEAKSFLRMVNRAVGHNGMLLIGVDTKKSSVILNAAYNDEAGITAKFNLNVLHRMRNEAGLKCEPELFDHLAFYNEDEGRIEMHLVNNEQQTLKINGCRFRMKSGEHLHTENSYKYSPTEFLNMAEESGFKQARHWIDEEGLFAIYLLKVV